MIHLRGTGPQNRLSSDSPRLSPIMNQWPAGIVIGRVKSQPVPPSQGRVKPSFWRLPLTYACPPLMYSVSPGPATTRLMKLTLAFWPVGRSQAWSGFLSASPHVFVSDPAGGWKTTISPMCGLLKRLPSRLTSTRWPTLSVGTIDSLGIRYGLTRKAWIARARPRATTTMTMSSTNELPADLSFFLASPVGGLTLRLVGVGVGRGLAGRGSLGGGRLARGLGGRGVRSLDDLGLADDLVLRVTHDVDGAVAGGGLGLELRDGVVQQACLDDLLGADVAALADARGLADAVAQVVELRAPDVAAGGDLDLLDLRRVHGERALHADAERLLADGERLAHAVALALDHHALEDLRTATRALDDLEVDADAVARVEAGNPPQLGALKGVDDGAHGKEKGAEIGSARRLGDGSERGCAPPGGCATWDGSGVHRPEGVRSAPLGGCVGHRAEDVGPGGAALTGGGLGIGRVGRRADDAALLAAHAPPGGDLLVVAGEQHAGDLPAAVVRRPGVVRVLGVAAQRLAEGLLQRGLGVAERAGQLAQHGVHDDHRGQLAAGENEAPDGAGVRGEVLDDALVEALVAPAQQRDGRLARQLVDERVVEHAAARREGDDAALVAQVDRVLVVDALQGLVHDVDAQDHAGAAAERRVVDLAAAQRGPLARVERPDLVAVLRRVAHVALGAEPLEPLREQGEDVELHGRSAPVLAQEREVDVDDGGLHVDGAHGIGDERHQEVRGPFAARHLQQLTRRVGQQPLDGADRAVAVHDAAGLEVRGVALVLAPRRGVGAADAQLGAAQGVDGLAGRDDVQAHDRARVGAGQAHDLPLGAVDRHRAAEREDTRARLLDVKRAVQSMGAADATGADQPVGSRHINHRDGPLVDDVDEDAALFLDRRRLDHGAQGVGGPPALADHAAVVLLADGELQDDGAVVLVELLHGHLVGMVDELAGQVLEQLAHGRCEGPAALAAAGDLDALRAQDLADLRGRLGALVEPAADLLLVQVDRRGLGLGVVLPQDLDVAAVTGGAGIGGYDAPDRVRLAAHTR